MDLGGHRKKFRSRFYCRFKGQPAGKFSAKEMRVYDREMPVSPASDVGNTGKLHVNH